MKDRLDDLFPKPEEVSGQAPPELREIEGGRAPRPGFPSTWPGWWPGSWNGWKNDPPPGILHRHQLREYLLSLPWHSFTEDNLDIKRAEQILESQHSASSRFKEGSGVSRRPHPVSPVAFSGAGGGRREIARTNMEHVLTKEAIRSKPRPTAWKPWKGQRAHLRLILTDLKMDKWTAMQLLEAVKEVAPTPRLSMITGFATVTRRWRPCRKGAGCISCQAIKIEDWRATVKNILKKKRTSRNPGPCAVLCRPPGTGKTSIRPVHRPCPGNGNSSGCPWRA